MQTIGRDVLYTPRAELRLKTGRRNKMAVGLLASKLGEDYSHPFKVGAPHARACVCAWQVFAREGLLALATHTLSPLPARPRAHAHPGAACRFQG